MNKKSLAEAVCATSLSLVEKGLVARTWGNISARFNDETFLITPSGRPYETLTTDEIVPISMVDLSHTGNVKPSSEKNLHQVIYRAYSNVNAIIHTHQPFASSFAVARINLPGHAIPSGILKSKTVKCASYALPTTKKLATTVAKDLEGYDTPAIFLANHGAVCWGESLTETMQIAVELERVCERFILDAYRNKSGDRSGGFDQLISYYIEKHERGNHND